MKRPHILINLIAVFASALYPVAAQAVTLTGNDGSAYNGVISSYVDGTVVMTLDQGEVVEIPKVDLSPDSAREVESWARENPHLVDVYLKFDQPPTPAQTNNPANYMDKELKRETGMVTVDVVISESGEVLWASVARSSNDRLNDASIAAVSEWRFKPAMVNGSPIRSRIRVPFRY